MEKNTNEAQEMSRYCKGCLRLWGAVTQRLAEAKGQGTTEYAILLGVLGVIAFAAISLFKPKIEDLWNAITQGINGL